jgi:hypothetical protein
MTDVSRDNGILYSNPMLVSHITRKEHRRVTLLAGNLDAVLL